MAMPVSSPARDLPDARRGGTYRGSLAARAEELNRHCQLHGVFDSRISASSVLRHRVDQRRLTIFDLRDRHLKRRLESVGILDGAFGPPAHRAGEAGEVGRRSKQIHADMGAAQIRAAGARHDDLMVPVPIWQLAFLNGVGPRVGESGFGRIARFLYTAPYEDITLKSA
jgi:hypothetical protein